MLLSAAPLSNEVVLPELNFRTRRRKERKAPSFRWWCVILDPKKMIFYHISMLFALIFLIFSYYSSKITVNLNWIFSIYIKYHYASDQCINFVLIMLVWNNHYNHILNFKFLLSLFCFYIIYFKFISIISSRSLSYWLKKLTIWLKSVP